MEALYNGAKLLEHGARSPDTPLSVSPGRDAEAPERKHIGGGERQLQSQGWVFMFSALKRRRNSATRLGVASAVRTS